MSNKTLFKESNGAPRHGFDAYGIDRGRYMELRGGCASGKYRAEMLLKACSGFEFLTEWIIMSVAKNLSYDSLEKMWARGEIKYMACSRTSFYRHRRKFYSNLDRMLKEECDEKRDGTGVKLYGGGTV